MTTFHFIDELSWILVFIFCSYLFFHVNLFSLWISFLLFFFLIYLRVVLCIPWFSSRYHMAQTYFTRINKYNAHMLDTWFAYPGFFRRRRFWPSPLHRHLFTYGVIIWYSRFIDCNGAIKKCLPFSFIPTQELFGFLNLLYFFLIF